MCVYPISYFGHLLQRSVEAWIVDRGSWIVDRGSWIVDFRGSWIVDRGSWIVDRGLLIVDRGSWISVDRGLISVEFRLHTDCFFGVHLVHNFPWKREVHGRSASNFFGVCSFFRA